MYRTPVIIGKIGEPDTDAKQRFLVKKNLLICDWLPGVDVADPPSYV